MSKVSKTARASMIGADTTKKIERTDEQLIAELRNDRASHIWPSCPAIDALLRAYDAALAELQDIKIPKVRYVDVMNFNV